ncbi:MAG: SHOCT domain-containing protein [Clostridiales bacterium]|nr:SHOCT domain-containing protein [Clostridiales bacterium]
MRIEFEKVNWSTKGWVLEDDKIIFKKQEYKIEDLTDLMLSNPTSNLVFPFISAVCNGKKLALYFDKNEPVRNQGIEAYHYLLEHVKDAGKYVKNEEFKKNITASDALVGKEITEVLGMVNGSASYNPAGLIGEGYTSKVGNAYMNNAIETAKAKMIKVALEKGADGITSFKTTTSETGLNTILVTVTGTAVKTRDVKESQISNNPTSNTFSNADEIKKYKELLDMGIISQDEFDMKKRQLLGL